MEKQALQELNNLLAYKKNSPILVADQMPKKLSWSSIDEDWKQRMFWASNYQGALENEFEKGMLPQIQQLLQFRDFLLSFGGDEVVLPTVEEDLLKIRDRGQLWYGDRIYMMEGLPSQCHGNSANLWQANRENKQNPVHLVTGYALSKDDGMWRQHSWLVWQFPRANKIIETTEPRIAYFGFVLTTEEAERFCWENE